MSGAKMISKDRIHNLIRMAGLITGLLVLQQLVSYALFGLTFSWSAMPQLILVNFSIVAVWYYFKNIDKKVPAFIIVIAAFFFAVGLRAVLIYLGVFRFVAPHVASFIEKQFAYIMALMTMPQFIPTMFAALILLLLLPKAKEVYRRIISNGAF